MRIEPQNAARPACLGEAAQRSERNGVVPAEHKWQQAVLTRALYFVRNADTGLEDLVEEACPLRAAPSRLGERSLDWAHDPVGPLYRASPSVTRVCPASR